MAKMVGYACSIKLLWLDQAVRMLSENLSESRYKEKLNEYLSFEIDSATRLRKTREILMNIWYYDSDEITPIRSHALKLLDAHPEYNVAIHLCMIYLTYPVVADVCKFMGRLFEFQDVVTNAALTQKLYDEWGERGSLEATCRRVTLTLKEMGILENQTRVRYSLKRQNVSNYDVVNFLLYVAMKIDGSSYYSFANLTEFNCLFPFDYTVSKEQLIQDERFTLGNYDGQLTVALKE